MPTGQVPFESRISGRTEYYPVIGSMVGAKGSDLMLFNLANDALGKAGWRNTVDVGRFAFKLGDGTRHVASEDDGFDRKL